MTRGKGANVRAFQVAAAIFLGLTAAAQAAEVELRLPSSDEALGLALRAASLSVASEARGITDADEVIAAARADYARLVAAAYEQGYFAPIISVRVDGQEASRLSPFAKLSQVNRVVLDVDPGPRFTFGTADIAPLAPEAGPAEGFAPGAQASTAVLKAAVDQGIADWRAAGHAKAGLTQQSITADHPKAQLNATIRIAPGPRLRFGPLDVLSPSGVTDRRLRKIAGLPEGAVFDPALIETAANRLRRTGVFSSVVIREGETPQGDVLPMSLEVVDNKPRRFGFGAEISNVDGGRLSAYWLHRNLMGGAERLRFDVEIGGIGGSKGEEDFALSTSITRPATLSADTDATLGFAIKRLQEPNYSSDLVTANAGLLHRATSTLDVTLDVGLRFDQTQASGVETTYRHGLISLGGTLERRDDPLNPRLGYFADVDLTGFIGLGGSESGFRATADLRGYRPVGERTVLAARVQAGAVWEASTAGTPPDFRFFSGGGGSVRGQEFQSLNAAGAGGLGYFGLNSEIRQDFSETIGGVAFFDAGYVSANSDFSNGEWHSGAGLGLRYLTPIGPIRLDVGLPVEKGDGAKLYLGIGQAF